MHAGLPVQPVCFRSSGPGAVQERQGRHGHWGGSWDTHDSRGCCGQAHAMPCISRYPSRCPNRWRALSSRSWSYVHNARFYVWQDMRLSCVSVLQHWDAATLRQVEYKASDRITLGRLTAHYFLAEQKGLTLNKVQIAKH